MGDAVADVVNALEGWDDFFIVGHDDDSGLEALGHVGCDVRRGLDVVVGDGEDVGHAFDEQADDLLPERALAGDSAAKSTLVERIYRPLQAHSSDLVTTLWSYLDNGRSLEATARELFVHPNTVRYRLKRVSDVIGWDATGPREALILQTALIIGSIGTEVTRRRAVRRPG